MSDKLTIPCPACREDGSDNSGDHLTIWPTGKFSCAVYPGDKEHNRRIIELMPELGKGPESTYRNGHTSKPKKQELGPVVATYTYHNAEGIPGYEVRRHSPKDFRQWRIVDGKPVAGMEGVTRVPYHLPELIQAETVWIVEGEKDADHLGYFGVVATCNAGGAGKWDASWGHYFKGKDIVLCGDNDAPGHRHVDQVEAALKPVARSIKRVTVPEPSKDVSDVLEGLSDSEGRSEVEKLLSTAVEVDKTPGESADGIIRKNLLELYQEPPKPECKLLGDRWLCRLGCVLFVAPTGVGKSSASFQMVINWTAGKPAFGITPAKPLRILIIQTENDAGDLHEMVRGVIGGLNLTEGEIQALGTGVRVVSMHGKVGNAFIAQLDKELESFPCDILLIDPVTGFFGEEVKDSRATNKFLREGIQPLLIKHNCGLILILHTPKTNHRDTSEWKDHDWMYAGAGAADWSNFARAILIIEPKTYPVFEFRATKRRQRIGWADTNGNPVSIQYWAHTPQSGTIFWEPATAGQSETAQVKEKSRYDILALVPEEGTIEKKALVSKAGGFKIGQVKAKGFLAELLQDGILEPVPVPRSGTRPEEHVQRKR